MEANAGEYIKKYLHLKRFPCISLHYKLVPVQHWQYEYVLLIGSRYSYGACTPTYRVTFVWPWFQVFAICFTDQCWARLKQSLSIFLPKKPLIWAVNSSIAQSHFCISNVIKAKLSRKFHGKMTLFPSAFVRPMKIRARLFLFDKLIKCFAFLFMFWFYVLFFKVIWKSLLEWFLQVLTLTLTDIAKQLLKANRFKMGAYT